ncbi:MAG: hypothetical protein ABIR15_01395 [Chitinophagaceae bacterium]
MTENLYITSSCSIVNNIVIKDSKVLFENEGIDPQAFLVSAYQYFAVNYPRFYKMDNLGKLGWLAAEILLNNSFDKTMYQPENIGLVLANKSSSLDTDIKYYETVKTFASPALFVYTLPNIVMGEICIRHNFKGENDFFIFENFDAGFIQQYVSYLFTTGALEACICGWVEIIGNEYQASLYLVEKKENGNTILFTEENISHIYQITHG